MSEITAEEIRERSTDKRADQRLTTIKGRWQQQENETLATTDVAWMLAKIRDDGSDIAKLLAAVESLTAERDALKAAVERVEALCNEVVLGGYLTTGLIRAALSAGPVGTGEEQRP